MMTFSGRACLCHAEYQRAGGFTRLQRSEICLAGRRVCHLCGVPEAFHIAGFEPEIVTRVNDIFSMLSWFRRASAYADAGQDEEGLRNSVQLLKLAEPYQMQQLIAIVFARNREGPEPAGISRRRADVCAQPAGKCVIQNKATEPVGPVRRSRHRAKSHARSLPARCTATSTPLRSSDMVSPSHAA